MNQYAFLPWATLVASIIITLATWIGYYDFINENQATQFNLESSEMLNSVEDRLLQYRSIIIGTQGLFAASQQVNLDEWNTFVSSQNIHERFPGIQGVGYIKYVSSEEERENLIKLMKDFGASSFDIKPEGQRTEYFPIIYLYPQDFRNLRAMGYDVYSEQIRAQAVDTAIETGQMTMTGKITLVQETDVDIQNGFLMLLPIYSNEDPSKLEGLVYNVFRIDDFMLGLFDKEIFEKSIIKIYDGNYSSDDLLFDSEKLVPYSGSMDFSKQETLNIGNHKWIFFFGKEKTIDDSFAQLFTILIPVTGFAMSALLFFSLYYLNRNLILTRKALDVSKFTTIGELASRIAHDMRNPLTIIKTNMDLIQKNDEMSESVQNRFKMMNEAVFRMSHQISNVLDFVKEKPQIFEQNSIKKIIESSQKDLIIPKNVKISITGNDFNINCDFSNMRTVFNNLILNAIQAIKNSGTIKINLSQDAMNYIITVEDSGTGIPKDDLSKIFDPLFTTKQEGTGLGLSSVKSIIEQHHGTISVSLNPTTFTIKISKKY